MAYRQMRERVKIKEGEGKSGMVSFLNEIYISKRGGCQLQNNNFLTNGD
jgi:hypothetical protein